eukprot:GCRY01005941.1.p1 GENE.GCRY01005941.1~~GCRY01005941.1.p1  ORF type:complete len:179 (-),score=47.64 GCRY01005941.1:279-815(-)
MSEKKEGKFTIRALQEGDNLQLTELLSLQALAHASYNPAFYLPNTPDTVERMIKYLKAHDTKGFVAVSTEDGVMAAVLLYTVEHEYPDTVLSDSPVGVGEIVELFVRKEYRRHHLGQLLCETVENALKEIGVLHIKLSCAVQNAEGQLFYEAGGYVAKKVVMVKALDAHQPTLPSSSS